MQQLEEWRAVQLIDEWSVMQEAREVGLYADIWCVVWDEDPDFGEVAELGWMVCAGRGFWGSCPI